jgi:Sec7-like guanine-nucleotide exchange factor
MDFFDFSDISIDEAFRNLCLKLKLIGESQMIDRILFQVSRRYWDCNPKQQDVYGCIDVVYGILFSIVLLNTDLNTVNIGARQHKKMSQKVFVKNTMDLIQVMMESQNENMEHINLMKHWKKEIEQILKVLNGS